MKRSRRNTVTKQDLVVNIVNRMGNAYTKTDVLKIVTYFLEEIVEQVSKNRRVELRGFGIFTLRKWKKKSVRLPTMGDGMVIPERYVPHFKASSVFKKLVNKK